MTHTSKKLKNLDLELTVILDQKDLEYYARQAVEELKDSVQINGYRKGKAPSDVLRKNIGEARIKENALNIAVQSSLAKAIQKGGFDILDYSNLQIKENTPASLVFTVLLSVFPEIELGRYKGVAVKAKLISVNEKDIEQTLEDVKKSRTEFKDSKEPAKTGDRVEVDFEVTEGGQLIEGGKSENHPLILGNGNFVPGFEEQLKGMIPGEEKSFLLKVPEQYYQKAIAGRNLDFHVTMKKISYPVIPVMDDNFAQALGNFASLDDLKLNIRDGLLEEKKAKESERIKLAIIDEILKETKVIVPQSMLGRYLDQMVSGFDQELHSKGLELGFYLAQIKKTQEELRVGFIPQAEKQAKTSLIFRAIGKREEIEVSDSEVDNRLREINASVNLQDELSDNNIDVEGLKQKVRQVLFSDKVLKLLLKKSVIIQD